MTINFVKWLLGTVAALVFWLFGVWVCGCMFIHFTIPALSLPEVQEPEMHTVIGLLALGSIVAFLVWLWFIKVIIKIAVEEFKSIFKSKQRS
ncbi:MAG: hypothetical protein WCW02_02660 [Candidatus Buchananbacteria bacterium]